MKTATFKLRGKIQIASTMVKEEKSTYPRSEQPKRTLAARVPNVRGVIRKEIRLLRTCNVVEKKTLKLCVSAFYINS